mmetsp:Transcript_21091/g.51599  ORF Transcript_21091/g.51599 Transcript_21091/m.51599 type:complete len:1092 (-) Transcript_21091:288-3563(-)|eukprot:CAMPEP_0114534526 /NCGR_PEP_ID=MMETSP0109-20121206/27890_1 /TAXON_ID=29199 /ORGANISM="Chlorarachnion reptans, Strain CCCM449" /LENGTH=1091 /DNA_ID=CAMNT_0001717951 /DNA_START=114 /DNA_END=3389 /DNA_ORIENTATION=-
MESDGLSSTATATAARTFGYGSCVEAQDTKRELGVRLTSNCVLIQNKPRLLRVGSLQWFRLPESDWADLLGRFKDSGLNTVDMYVPWRDVEPAEGKFDEGVLGSMCRFLEMVQQKGLFVYFRPGPYICDELDGGGVPAWLLKRARTRDDDVGDEDGSGGGRVIMRTACRNWLRYVERYFEEVNRRVVPYLASKGGPVVIYAVENEYDHFEKAFQAEKLFSSAGRPERRLLQQTGTAEYLGRLRDLARRHIDVPIASCPGMPGIGGLADTPGIWPLPNHWPPDGHEANAATLLAHMHDPRLHNGIYCDMPGGFSEGPALASSQKRQLMAGLRVAATFNAVGSHQYGYRNTIDFDPKTIGVTMAGMSNLRPRASSFSWARGRLRNLLFHPRVGYMSGVLDFYGPISHSGSLREKFYSFRRNGLFFDTFEGLIAKSRPRRAFASGRSGWGWSSRCCYPRDDVCLRSRGAVGAIVAGRRFVNWLDAGNGILFISLLNTSGRPQHLEPGSLRIFDDDVPKYTKLAVQTEAYPGSQSDVEQLTNTVIIPAGLPLSPCLCLRYSTAEVLTQFSFEEVSQPRKVLILYGKAGDEGEVVLDILDNADVKIVHLDNNMKLQKKDNSTIEVSFLYEGGSSIVFRTEGKYELFQIVVTTRALAGRTWFVGKRFGQPVVLSGFDYVCEDEKESHGKSVQISCEHTTATKSVEIMVMSPKPVSLESAIVVSPFKGSTYIARFNYLLPKQLPTISPGILKGGRLILDNMEAQTEFDDSKWIKLVGEPVSLDDIGIHEGHAWYRAHVVLNAGEVKTCSRLRIDHADDIVTVYVNGTYIATVAPLGNGIDTDDNDYAEVDVKIAGSLRSGINVIAFLVEIWGHGAFEMPIGGLVNSNLSLPALSPRGKKGLHGKAYIGSFELSTWKVRAKLGREIQPKNGSAVSVGGISENKLGSVSIQLEPGAVVWYEVEFATDELPAIDKFNAPVMLRLVGKNAGATVFLNNIPVPIGRWLSDDEWLHRGTWANPTREMWSYTNPDHIPLPMRQLHRPPGRNLLRIAFKDASDGHQRGIVQEICFVLNDDDLGHDDNGKTVRKPHQSFRLQARLNL